MMLMFLPVTQLRAQREACTAMDTPAYFSWALSTRRHITIQNRHLHVHLTNKARQPQQQHHITRSVSLTAQGHATVPLYDPPYDRH
jgi:hypothetical protein